MVADIIETQLSLIFMDELISYSLYSTYQKLLCIPLHRIKDSLKNKNKPKPKQTNKKKFHTYSLPFATVLTLHVDHMRVCFSSVVSCCLSSYKARSLLEYALNIENYKVTMFYIFLICFFYFFVLEKYIGEGRNHLFFQQETASIMPELGKALSVAFCLVPIHFI